jgi:two-component system, chemotaxis family, CheB/CheR fusion protein
LVPISRIDLLLCRNTLMYFMADAQSSVLANFAFALKAEGALFLRKSEVLLTRSPLFVPLDLKRRIFCKAIGANQDEPNHPTRSGREQTIATDPPHDGIRRVAFESSPVAQFAVDPAGNLALANKAARQSLAIHPRDIGRPIQDLEISYRPLELRSLIDQAAKEHRAVSANGITVTGPDGQSARFDVLVHLLSNERGDTMGVSVAFMDTTRSRNLEDELEHSRRELETAYEELQSTVEELESMNDELQSTNEELETTNEELQSTNEELETMNEELQSTNEELETINDELRERTDDASQANAFLSSILASLQAGVIVIDDDFRVLAWNGRSEELWGLRTHEVAGQNLLGLDIGLPVELLRAPVRRCLATGTQEQLDVPARNRRGRPIVVDVECAPLRLGARDTAEGAILLLQDRPQQPDERP